MTKKETPTDINQPAKFIVQGTVKGPAQECEQPTPDDKNPTAVALGHLTHGKDAHIFN